MPFHSEKIHKPGSGQSQFSALQRSTNKWKKRWLAIITGVTVSSVKPVMVLALLPAS